MARFLLILLAIPVLLILAAAVLVPLFIDQQQLLALASKALHEQTGATLTVDGDASLHILPRIGLKLADAKLALPGEETPSISVGALNIGVQLIPLFSREVKIDALNLDQLDATLKSDPEQPEIDTSELSNEQLDAFYAARRQALAEANSATGGAEAALVVPLALEVQQLSVTDSIIRLQGADGDQPTTIRLKRLAATDLNLEDRPIPVELAMELPSADDSPPLAISMEGRLSVNLDSQLLTLADVDVSVTGATPDKISLTANGTAQLERKAADLKLQLQTGDIKGEGQLRYATFESPQIDATLHFNLLNPALLVIAGPEAAADASNEPTGETQALPLDAIRLIDSRADISIDSAVFGDHSITGLHTAVRAKDGIVRINTLTGTLHGGQLSLKANLNGQHNVAKLNTQGELKGMDIAAALEAMATEPVVTGKANLDWKLHSSGRSSDELVQALQGAINLDTEQLVLQQMGVEKMLCQAVALANRETLGASLPASSTFENMSAQIKLANGKARLDPLSAKLPEITLTGKGELDLTRQDFQARFAARLSPELATLDPACRVNERLTSIDWPVACKGEISGDPGDWCSVDSGDIVEELGKNEAKRKLQKEAGKLFDKLLNKD